MTLRIEHKSGPLAGKSQDFGDDVKRIAFGRDASRCQVVFPADFTLVSREHFSLEEELGHYRFKLDEDLPVFVNGKRAFPDQEFDANSGTQEVQLGSKSGPVFTLSAARTGQAAGMAATVKFEKAVSTHQIAATSQKRLRVVGAALSVVAIGVGIAFWWIGEVETKAVNLAEYIDKRATTEATAVSPETLKVIHDSVYLVLIRNISGVEVGAATAWVLDRENGILGTNAHVAEIFNQLGPTDTLEVRSPFAPYETHTVTAVDIHPGYYAFDQAVAEYEPVVLDLYGGIGQPSLVPAYDVGLLYVDKKEKLAADLKIAEDAALVDLLPGMAVAYVGYPAEQLSLSEMVAKPNPYTQAGGNLVAITDYFNVKREDNVNHLVQHNLGATGGASGSPIVNAKGEVVAVLSGGNIIITPEGRAPSAVGINFGQRADLIRQLHDGKAGEALVAYQRIWAEGLALFQNYRDVLPTVFQTDIMAWSGQSNPPTVLAQEVGEIGPVRQEWGVTATTYDYEVEPGLYAFYAIAKGEDDINLAVIKNGEVLGINNETDFHPIVGVQITEKSTIQVVVFGGSEKTPYDYWGGGWVGAAAPTN